MRSPLTGNMPLTNKQRCRSRTPKTTNRIIGAKVSASIRRQVKSGYPVSAKEFTQEETEQYTKQDYNSIECLLCGRRLKSLFAHMKLHEISLDAYRERYGFAYGLPMMCQALLEKHSVTGKKNAAEGKTSINHALSAPNDHKNSRISVAKKRASQENVKKAQASGYANSERARDIMSKAKRILTDNQIEYILSSNKHHKELAADLDVSESTIRYIRKGVRRYAKNNSASAE